MERAAGNGGYKGSRTDEDRLLLLMKTGDIAISQEHTFDDIQIEAVGS